MYAVRPDLALARTVIVSNVWLLRTTSGHRFLVDTGFSLERRALVRQLRRAGVTGPGDVTAILLTHRHADHAGNAAFLRDWLRCPVLCHDGDRPSLVGEARAPKISGRAAPFLHDLLCRIEDRWPPRVPVDGSLEEEAPRWDFRVLHVGGHTEGSSLVFHEPSGILFSGDALLSGIPPFRQFERLGLAVPWYSLDVTAAHEATRAACAGLAQVSTLAAGHGPAIVKDTDKKLRVFLRR